MTPSPIVREKPFAHVLACELVERPPEHRMLVEELWPESGVGVIGGLAKQGKTWIALDLAVSIATGTACLGRFAVPRPGPALIYTAEDPPFAVRDRLAGLCACRGIALSDLAVHVITEPTMHLDRPAQRARLRQTVLEIRPRVLILDPLVRVYGTVDENSATEVSGFLAYLRGLQRELDVAVVVVHHARKSPGPHASAGQSLRGSGDLYAWVDALLYLRRSRGQLELVVEHRSFPGREPIPLALLKQPSRPPHLVVVEPKSGDGLGSHAQSILSFLTRESLPRSTGDIRKALGLRKERVVGLLRWLEETGKIQRDGRGWRPTGGFDPTTSTVNEAAPVAALTAE